MVVPWESTDVGGCLEGLLEDYVSVISSFDEGPIEGTLEVGEEGNDVDGLDEADTSLPLKQK